MRLTIDAGLQSARRRHRRRTTRAGRRGRAAAVVIDPDTGALLASVSYPVAGDGRHGRDNATTAATRCSIARDTALYPPGSTFKLVVAMAALREPRDLANGIYACARLPDGRVGAAINGWGRPIRDDVLDTRPHGTIGMHDALVHSCNAYFAQLAVALGPEPLLDTASRFRIRLTKDPRDGQGAGPSRRVAESMPQVGYGQAQVVASPLRMAAVAATIAANGVLREPHVEAAADASREAHTGRDCRRRAAAGSLHA